MASPSPLKLIKRAIAQLSKGDEAVEAKALERLDRVPSSVPLDRIKPNTVARSTLLQPQPTAGWSENPITDRAPIGASLITPGEFLSRTPALNTQYDEALIEKLMQSIEKDKLKSLPLTWIDEYHPGGILQAQMDARHRMAALQRMGIEDPMLMNLYGGSEFNLEPSRWMPDTLDRNYLNDIQQSPLELLKRRMLTPRADVLAPKEQDYFQINPLWVKE